MREQILTLLERNSRLTPDEIAVLLGCGRDVVAEEIRRMEEEHIICGYNTLINWDHAGTEKVTVSAVSLTSVGSALLMFPAR